MNKFKINSNSWHFKFNVWFGDIYAVQKRRDFCSYWRLTARNVVFTTLMGSFVAFLLIMGVVLSVQNPLDAVAVVGMIIASLGFIAAVMWAINRLSIRRQRIRDENRAPGIIKTKYMSWKERHCPLIEYEDDHYGWMDEDY